MDFGEPLTPMAAFGLALAICDAKLAFARKLEGVRSASQLLRRQSTRVVPFAHEGEAPPAGLATMRSPYMAPGTAHQEAEVVEDVEEEQQQVS